MVEIIFNRSNNFIINVLSRRNIELFGKENLPNEQSQYIELSYTQNITPYAYVDLATHFDMQIKNLPYIFTNTEKFISSFKNL